jgi:UDP-N-acetylmuramate--alanine ligase
MDGNGSKFDLYINNELYGHFDLPLFGKHMILNAMASIIICKEQGITKEMMIERLHTFKNAKRRFAIEEVNNTIIIDDYAHHPTEIKVTLEAARQKYPDRELVAVFKPNTYSRTQKFPIEFQEALNIADKQYLTEIECNREKSEDYGNVTSKVIFDGLNNAEMMSDTEVESLATHKGSVICIMSCANIAHLKENLIKELNN